MNPKPDPQNTQEEQKRLLVAVLLSVAILIAFHFLYEKPRMEEIKRQQEIAEALKGDASVPADEGTAEGGDITGDEVALPRNEVLEKQTRIRIETPALKGSLPLTGNRIDDISLAKYFTTTAETDNVVLFSPSKTDAPYYAEFGWVAGGGAPVTLPGKNTQWTLRGDNDTLAPDSPVTMTWNNGEGLLFERRISIDENYLITVKQSVINNSGQTVELYPYSLISRHKAPETTTTLIMHEGPIAYLDKELQEYDYEDMEDEKLVEFEDDQGWLGITDKYWLSALIPDQKEMVKARFVYTEKGEEIKHFQVDLRGEARTIAPDTAASDTMYLFAGAKELSVLNTYENQLGMPHFDLAVDFGIFYFLTKPFFLALTWLFAATGNFGVAILIFTVLLRVLVFPMANKSFISMAKTKEVQPKLMELRDKYKDDKQRLQEEIMKLYQRENVNPLSGCFLMFLQIPVFFALYKVLYVTIEMRHAPFFGWIEDLSAPDPTTIFNLFGLIPWDPPQMLMIGIWPCIMLVTMVLQRRLQPEPPDPMQAKVMAMMPFMIAFILAKFAAGLVVYWAWNNFLSMIQQYVIMRRMGVPVSLLSRPTREDIQAAGKSLMSEPDAESGDADKSADTPAEKQESGKTAEKKTSGKKTGKKTGNKTGKKGRKKGGGPAKNPA